MKPNTVLNIKMKALAALVVVAAALLAHFFILPRVVQGWDLSDEAADGLRMRFTAILLLFGLFAAAAGQLLAAKFLSGDGVLESTIELIRQPVFLVDDRGRFLLVNGRARQTLALNGERDFGKPVPSDVLAAMDRSEILSDPDTFDPEASIVRDKQTYQVTCVKMPAPEDGAARRMVFLRNASSHIRVRQAIREINRTMDVLDNNTTKISTSAVSLSQGTTEQATSIAAITSSVDEFSRKIQGSSETAAKGTQLAAQAREAAERSGSEIAHALTAMTDVQDAGIRIARIVKLIDDIAFQTNLLALNAAVEAARAGRQGKGFAVVADEVRNLAGRSAKAAKDTASMVEDVTERIGNASAYISKLEEMLRNIVQDAIRMADSSATASETSSEQAAGILQVNRELGQMNSVTQNTMTAAEQTATAVEVLARQVKSLKSRLNNLSGEFSFGEDEHDNQRPFSINLTDDPDNAPPSHRLYYGDGQDDLDEPSLNRAFRRGETSSWNLEGDRFDSDSTLANLLRSDGYEDEYRDFLNTAQEQNRRAGGDPYAAPEDDEARELKTPDGDRIIKPSQTIQLDDSEFGRY